MKRDAEVSSPHVPTRADRKGRAPATAPDDDPIIVRPFEPDDAAAVRALFIAVNRLMAPRHMAEQFEAYIATALREEIDNIARYYAARGGQFFVASAAGGLVGMFGLEQAEPGAAELRRMYVDPRFRRRGIGRDLLARAETEAQKAGCKRMILSTSELQTAALTLYRNTGYRKVRQEVATRATNKTLGGAIRRFHFEKALPGMARSPLPAIT
ncbi:MAG: GNAT family N-acetyltransferase [Silicimonas sp.]